MNNPQFSFDVFLSHNSKDKPQVRRLAERLRTAGLRVWFDEWGIQPGDDIYLAIERGKEASQYLVLCLSQSALDSDWVSLERSAALIRDPINKDRRFIPLLLSECKLPDALQRYKYVDYREETDEGFAQVLQACKFEEIDNKESTHVIEKKLIGENWNKALVRLRDSWLNSGRPVALLDGFPGTGKTELAHELCNVPNWVVVPVEPSQSEGFEKDYLFNELASELEIRGIDDLVIQLDREESVDFVRVLKRVLEQQQIVIIIDEAQRVFESASARPFGALRSLIQKLGDAPRVKGKLLLISNRRVESELWSEKCERATLAPLSGSEAVKLLSRLLSESNLADAIPPERLNDAAFHMGYNPRALHTLVTTLKVNGYTIDDLIREFSDLWHADTIATRIDNPDLISRLERGLLERTLFGVDLKLDKFLRWLSVHRRSFHRDALQFYESDHIDVANLRLRLIDCFLLDSHRNLYRIHPIAREICEYRLRDNKEEWQKAHSIAADYHLRHFKAKRLIKNETLAPSFAELKYHLHHANRLGELVYAAHRYTNYLKTTFGTSTSIPTNIDALDERIALLTELLEKPGNKPVEYHLAGCLEKRRNLGDLEKAVLHLRRATGANAFYAAWLLRLNVEAEIFGQERIKTIISEASSYMSADSQILALYKRGSDILANANQEKDAIALLKQGISTISPERGICGLYQSCAQLLDKIGNTDEGIELLRDGLRRFPTGKGIISIYQFCAELLDKNERTEEAIVVLRNGIKILSSSNNLAPLYLATASLSKKTQNIAKIDDAIALLRQGMKTTPPEKSLQELYQACGNLLSLVGRYEEAILVLRVGLSQIPFEKFGRYMLSESAIRLAADHKRTIDIEEILDGQGIHKIEAQQRILGQCFLHQLNGELREMRRTAEAGLKIFPKFEALKPFIIDI